MPQIKSEAESFGAAFYGNARASVVDISDKLLGGKAEAKKPFRMAAKDGVGEIFIYEDIGESFWGDGTTAKSFADDLKALGKVRILNIFVNSPGGSVFVGLSIYNQLRRHTARKNVFIDGIAASIASVIAMAGDEINIAANGFMMIHKPMAGNFGTDTEHHKIGDQLTKIGDSIINTYAERTGSPENVIGDMMEAETWMNAEEAVELGFADKITEEVQIAARFDLGQFSNVPEDVAAKLDLAKNPPKVELGVKSEADAGGLLGPTGVALATVDSDGNWATTEALDGELSRRVEEAAASIAGKVGALLPAETEQGAGPEPEPEPRTPSLAITKMRARNQRRGIARKGDTETPTAV